MNPNELDAEILSGTTTREPSGRGLPAEEDQAILAGTRTSDSEMFPEGSMKEVAAGVGEGALQAGAMTLGPYAATKAGMVLGMPFGPKGVLAGGVVGFGVGAVSGIMAQDAISGLFPSVAQEDLAPYREGGKALGATIAVAPLAFRIPVEQAKNVSFFLNNMDKSLSALPMGKQAGQMGSFIMKTAALMGETIKKYPKSTLAVEGLAGVGSGFGAGYAASRYPGDEGRQFIGEVAGGVLTPGRTLVSGSIVARSWLGNLISTVSKDSREGRAASRLKDVLEAGGEDPEKIARALLKREPIGSKLSPAEKTGSPTLTALQAKFARENAQYRGQMQKNATETLQAYERLLKNLSDVATGNPKALREVAEMRNAHFNDMLGKRNDLAHAEAARRISKITSDTPQMRVEIGTIVKRQVDDALVDIRQHESTLWDRAYKDSATITTAPDGTKLAQMKKVVPLQTGETFLDIVTSMTEARYKRRMPEEIKDMMRSMGIDDSVIARYREGKQSVEFIETGVVPQRFLTKTAPDGSSTPVFGETDAQDMIRTRGDLLAFARTAAADGQLDNANFYGRMSESILDDLQQLNTSAYDEARGFSKAVADYYRRTYAGDIALGKTRTGAERVPAELLVNRAFGSNADLTAKRMQDIQGAVGMMRGQYDNAVTQFGADSPQALELKPFADLADVRVDSVLDAQQRVLRLAAAKSVDRNTGRVNVGRLQELLDGPTRPLLDQAGVTADLTDAIQAENIFKAVSDQNSFINKNLRNQTAFAMVLGRENPTLAVTDVLTSKYPVKNFTNIAQLAKSGGPDAVAGLKSILFDYAYTRGLPRTAGSGDFNVAAFRKALFDPIEPGQPSLLNIMRSKGLIEKSEVRNLLSILRPMERIEKVKNNSVLMDELVQNADVITDFGLRILGSRVGRYFGAGGPSSLIAAQAGSSAVRNLLDKQPTLMLKGILQEASQDSTLMGILLQKPTTPLGRIKQAQTLHAYLGAAGLNYAELEMPEQVDQSPKPPSRYGQSSSDMLFNMLGGRKQPPAPVSRGVPNMQLPTAQGPAEQAQAQQQPGVAPQAPGGESRQMLQQLFPFDATLQAAPQGQ